MRYKNLNGEQEFSLSYDKETDELLIEYVGNKRKVSPYCETLKINGTELSDILVKRDSEGRIARIKIANCSQSSCNGRLSDILNQVFGDFPMMLIQNPAFKKS